MKCVLCNLRSFPLERARRERGGGEREEGRTAGFTQRGAPLVEDRMGDFVIILP